MKKIINIFTKNENGQSVVELALTLPILILVLCAIIDFGWVFSNKLLILYSSREGARYGAVNATAPESQTLIIEKTLDTIPSYLKDRVVVSVTFSDNSVPENGDVKVYIVCNVKPLTPLTGIFIQGENIVLDAKCVMKVEQ